MGKPERYTEADIAHFLRPGQKIEDIRANPDSFRGYHDTYAGLESTYGLSRLVGQPLPSDINIVYIGYNNITPDKFDLSRCRGQIPGVLRQGVSAHIYFGEPHIEMLCSAMLGRAAERGDYGYRFNVNQLRAETNWDAIYAPTGPHTLHIRLVPKPNRVDRSGNSLPEDRVQLAKFIGQDRYRLPLPTRANRYSSTH